MHTSITSIRQKHRFICIVFFSACLWQNCGGEWTSPTSRRGHCRLCVTGAETWTAPDKPKTLVAEAASMIALPAGAITVFKMCLTPSGFRVATQWFWPSAIELFHVTAGIQVFCFIVFHSVVAVSLSSLCGVDSGKTWASNAATPHPLPTTAKPPPPTPPALLFPMRWKH